MLKRMNLITTKLHAGLLAAARFLMEHSGSSLMRCRHKALQIARHCRHDLG